jgi:hypothetical protein
MGKWQIMSLLSLLLSTAYYRADKNNKTCDTLSLEDKTSYEKIHTRYCKTILGL